MGRKGGKERRPAEEGEGGKRTKKREKRGKREGEEDGVGGRVQEIWWGREKNDNPKFCMSSLHYVQTETRCRTIQSVITGCVEPAESTSLTSKKLHIVEFTPLSAIWPKCEIYITSIFVN